MAEQKKQNQLEYSSLRLRSHINCFWRTLHITAWVILFDLWSWNAKVKFSWQTDQLPFVSGANYQVITNQLPTGKETLLCQTIWQSTSTTSTNNVSVSEQRIVRPSIYARRVKYRSTLNDQVTTGCQEKLHVDKGHQQISVDCWTTRIFFVVLHRNTIDWQKIIGRHLLFSPISLVPSLGRRYHPIIERWNAVVDLYM